MVRSVALWAIIAMSAAARADERPPCLTEDEVLDAAQAAMPLRYDALVDLQAAGSERYFRLLHTTAHQLESPDMVEAAARLDAARARLDRLGADWAEATPAERATLERQLATAAEAVVDAEQAVKKIRQAQLRAALDELNAELRALDQERDVLVEQAIDRATR